MSRGTRIAKAQGRAHDRLRAIFLKDQCLKILEGDQQAYTTTATFDSHWYLDRREYTEQVSGKKFKRLVVDDVDGCRLAKLKTMTAVEHGGIVYTIRAKDSFISAVPTYEFKVYPVGVR
jgi:hypothetical protein